MRILYSFMHVIVISICCLDDRIYQLFCFVLAFFEKQTNKGGLINKEELTSQAAAPSYGFT